MECIKRKSVTVIVTVSRLVVVVDVEPPGKSKVQELLSIKVASDDSSIA